MWKDNVFVEVNSTLLANKVNQKKLRIVGKNLSH